MAHLQKKVEFSKVYQLFARQNLAQVNGIEQTLFELIHSDCQLIIIGQALACKFLTFTGTIKKGFANQNPYTL